MTSVKAFSTIIPMNGNGTTTDSLTIDQLAQTTGVTTRNIRAHQARGLLPSPTVRVRSPALLRAGEALARLGVSVESLIDVQEELLRHAEGVAKAFVRLFLKEVWKPFDEAGQPEERWAEVRAALSAMVPVAHEALAASFRVTMSTEVEAALEKVLKKQAKRAR